jgi:hypothetical protein
MYTTVWFKHRNVNDEVIHRQQCHRISLLWFIKIRKCVWRFKIPDFHNRDTKQDRPMWSGCKPSGLGFDSRRYQIFCVAVGMERGPLSLVKINEELLERNVAAPGLEN